MALIPAYSPGDQNMRGQNITVFEGERNRTANAQRAALEDKFLRDQMAQKGSQFSRELAWSKQQAAEAAAQAEQNRWFGLGESLLQGTGSAVGGYLGRR